MGTDLFGAWLSALNSHDGDSLAALMTDDGVYEVVPTGNVFTRATVRLSVTTMHGMSSDFSVNLVSALQDGDRYGIEWEVDGTNDGPIAYLGLPASGRTFKIRAAALGWSEGDKIKVHREYWDVAGFLTQLGVPPPPMVVFGLGSFAEEASGDP